MQKTMAAGLVALALGVATVEARADGGRWVLTDDGTWILHDASTPEEVPATAVGAWSPPGARAAGTAERGEGRADRRDGDDDGDGDGDGAAADADDADADADRHERDERDEARRKDDDPPMRSGWGFAGGIALTAIGGSLLTGAALASIPVAYEGNGGDPGSEVATVAVLGVAATAVGIGLILWGRAPASGSRTTLSVGPGDVRLTGAF